MTCFHSAASQLTLFNLFHAIYSIATLWIKSSCIALILIFSSAYIRMYNKISYNDKPVTIHPIVLFNRRNIIIAQVV